MDGDEDEELSDEELYQRWGSGDNRAGHLLFKRYFDVLCEFFQKKASTDVEDLVQQTMFACVEARDRFQGRARFRTFLWAIRKHVLYEYYRKKRRAGQRFDPDSDALVDVGVGPVTAKLEREQRKIVTIALHRIPINDQFLLTDYYLDGMSAPELAEVHGLSEPAVRSRLRRAKKRLRTALGAVEASPGLVEATTRDLEAWLISLRASKKPPLS